MRRLPQAQSERDKTDLRIAVVCFAVNPGFVDYLVGLVAALRQHAEISVLTSDTVDQPHRNMLGDADFCFRRSRHLPVDIWIYIWRVLSAKPDIVLVQAWLKVPLLEIPAIALFRLFGISCVVTVHDVLPHNLRPWHRPILRLYYRAFDALVAHSHAAREQLGALGIRQPIAVIPHALLDRFNLDHLTKEAARARLGGVEDDAFVALFFGHVTKRKGALAFAEAAKHLPPHANVKLIIAGQPDLAAPDLHRLRSDCSEFGVTFREGHVAFEDVQTLFAGADCVAIPYLEGTTSGVLKVAIAFEKPVVATAVGDVAETVDSRSAVLIQADDLPAAIAAGILQAKLRCRELEDGVRAIKAALSWDEIGRRYYAYLVDIAKSRHGVGRCGPTLDVLGP
jgi:glycosyltransferase involved in cell wall biosynthesis